MDSSWIIASFDDAFLCIVCLKFLIQGHTDFMLLACDTSYIKSLIIARFNYEYIIWPSNRKTARWLIIIRKMIITSMLFSYDDISFLWNYNRAIATFSQWEYQYAFLFIHLLLLSWLFYKMVIRVKSKFDKDLQVILSLQ